MKGFIRHAASSLPWPAVFISAAAAVVCLPMCARADVAPAGFETTVQMPPAINWIHPDNRVVILCPAPEPGTMPPTWLVRLGSMLHSKGLNPLVAPAVSGEPAAVVTCGSPAMAGVKPGVPVHAVKTPLKDAEVDALVSAISEPAPLPEGQETLQKMLFLVSSGSDVARSLYIQLAWVAHYARLSADFLDAAELEKMPSASFRQYAAVAIATDRIPQAVAPGLAASLQAYVADGGGLVDLVGLEDDLFYGLFGIRGLKSDQPAIVKTYRFEPDFLPGSTGYDPVLDDDGWDRCPLYDFEPGTRVVVWGGGDGPKDIPMAFTHAAGKGRTFAWATGRVADKSSRGLILLSLLSVARHAGAAAIMNSFTLWVDDCPLPMAEQSRPPADTLYGLRDDEFYLKVWWPQISALIEKYGLRSTFAMIMNYDLKTSGEFSTSAYESVDEQSAPVALARMIRDKGWQIGIHGYNHQSLTMAKNEWSLGWPSYQSMRDSLIWFRAEYQRLFGTDAVPRVYVAPSNFIQKMGKQALKEAFPELVAIAGQYLPEGSIPGDEFGPDQHVPGIIDIPRLSSEYYILGHNAQEHLDGLWVPGIVAHFIHPDDLFDPERARGYSQEELTAMLDGVLANVDRNYPFLKRRDGVELARLVESWPEIGLKVSTSAAGMVLSAENAPSEGVTVVVKTPPGRTVRIRTESGCPETFRSPSEGRYYFQVGKSACRVEFE